MAGYWTSQMNLGSMMSEIYTTQLNIPNTKVCMKDNIHLK